MHIPRAADQRIAAPDGIHGVIHEEGDLCIHGNEDLKIAVDMQGIDRGIRKVDRISAVHSSVAHGADGNGEVRKIGYSLGLVHKAFSLH